MNAYDLALKYGMTPEWVCDQHGDDIIAIRLDVVARRLAELEGDR